MKTTKLPAALAALLIPSLLFADTVEVTFDAALTNETGWVYSSDIKNNNTGYYVAGHSAMITSPRFCFAVTSVVLRVKTTNRCTRNLIISALDPDASATNLSQTFENIPQGEDCLEITAAWKASHKVTAVAVESNKGAQNLYFLSATISGVPIIDAPTNLQADDIKGTRFRLSWTNPENAVSNRIELSEIVEIETNCGSVLEYDFNDFTNNNNSAKDITDDFTNSIPAFTGSTLIRLPAHTNGIIQISKDDTKGYLVHSGFADYSNMSMVISLRVPTDSQLKTFGVGYLSSEGTTNEFATFSMEVAFQTNTVSLADVPANASIVLNTQGTSHKRVVYVDYLAFVNTGPTTICETNLVKTAFVTDSTTYSVRGLCPRTEYVARITAFDAEGNESSPSEPLAVTTNGEALPFSIHIQ